MTTQVNKIEKAIKSGTTVRIPVVAKSEKSDDGSVVMVMSTELKDRGGDVMIMDGADISNFKNNPIILWMHLSSPGMFSSDYNEDNALGYGEPFFEDGKLKVKIHFEPADLNTKADKIRRKVEFGTLSAGSIGFIPKEASYGDKEKGEDPNAFYIKKWELLEYSIVTIPMLQNALVERGHSSNVWEDHEDNSSDEILLEMTDKEIEDIFDEIIEDEKLSPSHEGEGYLFNIKIA